MRLTQLTTDLTTNPPTVTFALEMDLGELDAITDGARYAVERVKDMRGPKVILAAMRDLWDILSIVGIRTM